MNGDNMLTEMMELIFICIVFVGVLWLTYFVTKKIGMVNKGINSGKNMEIVEVLPLMQGQYLYIVKVGESYYLMGCAQKGNITYLKELDEQQIKVKENTGACFQEQFMYFMKGKQGTKDEE